jgi:nitroimidazol reductase NimA-like FMN-containing flavoprotein (pyridoxamine 5'-phosphate oxidase superfamily)
MSASETPPPVEPAPGVEVLDEEECMRLLGTQDLGRIGVVVDGGPVILPVNYAMAEGIIAFRTAPGTKLTSAPMAQVAFEVDGVDRANGTAWSVLVKGVAYEVTHALGSAPEAVRRLTVRPLASGERSHWLAIFQREVTGRRFRFGAS